MALFGSKKKTEAKKDVAETKAVATVDATRVGSRSLSHIIKRPRITEKASVMSELGVYTFEVSSDSTKKTIAEAVKGLYNVTPVKVTVSSVPAKKVFVRGKWGIKKGAKKAYVFLKKGDTIEFV
ncbi:MAG: 50S ribosomal protein L23 [Patescibacteria group bacterium]